MFLLQLHPQQNIRNYFPDQDNLQDDAIYQKLIQSTDENNITKDLLTKILQGIHNDATWQLADQLPVGWWWGGGRMHSNPSEELIYRNANHANVVTLVGSRFRKVEAN